MIIGEVSLQTNDVIRLADFYKRLFKIDNNSNDDVHQVIISEGTSLTIYNDGMIRSGNHKNICLAFTVDNVDDEFIRLLNMGVVITEEPTQRPWGAKNMYFEDPDGNCIVFRSFPK